MNDNNKYHKELKLVKEKLEKEYGYTVGYISLYGSQNYNLQVDNEDYKSDIDMKAIIIPSLDDLVNRTKTSIEIEINENNIEKVDVKDIKSFTSVLIKANPAYLELFVGPYYYINENFKEHFQWMRNNIEHLIYTNRCKLIKAIYGMAMGKQENMTKETEGTKEMVQEYGYNNKDLHHIVRLYHLAKAYYLYPLGFKDSLWYRNDNEKLLDSEYIYEESHKDFEPILSSKFHYSNQISDSELSLACFERNILIDKDILLKLKTDFVSLEIAEAMAIMHLNMIHQIVDKVLINTDESKIDYDINEEYLDIAKKVIKESIEIELR